MNIGEVWVLRCVGMTALCLILHVEDGWFDFLNLETGRRTRWHDQPLFGHKVGEWWRWEPC